MQNLIQLFYEKYAVTQTVTTRNFITAIDWSNRLIGIKGSRGVGKTTLLLQYIKRNFKPDATVLYISLDHFYFLENRLYDLVDEFYKKGGVFIAIDEVHKYPNWAIELKNIYDNMPDLRIVFTGSSLLHLNQSKADLSRRAVMYTMPGLSFREFLEFETQTSLPVYKLNEILENHVQIAVDIKAGIKPLQFFESYLRYGYYPYYLENKEAYYKKIQETIMTILEVDIPQYANISPSNSIYLKKLMAVISNATPFKPNMNALSSRTGISLNTMKNYLKLLSDAALLQLLYVENKGINSLNKPEKIFIDNTNLMHVLSATTNIGNSRETFFFNQLRFKHTVHASKTTDFYIDRHYSFEIGGKNKTFRQIKDLQTAFLVKDNIEIGSA